MRRLVLLTAALMAAAPIAHHARVAQAQRLGPPADRPRIDGIADTNDARAYFDAGAALMEKDPEAAADAFYWAARINPAWGEPLYARRSALIMRDQGLLRQTFESRRRSRELRQLDSLSFRALMLNPFLYRQFDLPMFMTYFRSSIQRQSRMSGRGEPGSVELDYYIDRWLDSGGPEMRGWMAYSRGSFQLALTNYALALGRAKDKSTIRFDRGRIFAMQGMADSALAELQLAIAEQQGQDQKELVVFYESKALAAYSMATLHEGAGETAKAREAYGQALQEDLAYYPAHMRLGLLALGQHDTATALSETALAAQAAPDEPHIRYVNGFVLAAAKKYKDAEAELKKAIELEPYYALPYLWLGQVDEMLAKGPEAVSAYQEFLAHAAQNDMQRAFATKRLETVKSLMAEMSTIGKP